FISLTNGKICIICSSESNPACADPFDSSNASFIQISGYNYCQKNVYSNGLITRFGGSTCSTSDIRGITAVYCCSNLDNCNYGEKLGSSFFINIAFIISLSFVKIIIFQ
ncbi:unnamed protein product, partial [Rotaria sp. Silwood2]